ncbi:hypothetical protein [Asinibacterium sp. OR53]|jgi:hypothetical protein|uniref:hypothetical protein n=1 Tax=Asinibacterium sp. OR53 TaxID=925409 RepID=UPI00040FFC9B|nr:hypothetical protein [Asinibacterium sp. OR53]
MKLLIVAAVQECDEAVANIFHQNGLYKYSVANIHGVNSNEAAGSFDNWFGSPTKEGINESIMMFCLTEDGAAQKTLAQLKQYNEQKQPDFPVRAAILPVEEFI